MEPESIQNYEQIQKIDLIWSEQAILNFFISKLLSDSEDGNNSIRELLIEQEEVKRIKDTIDASLHKGELTQEKCISILRTIFPEKIGSGNSRIDTFFLSYFTDTEKSSDVPYYPRVYSDFHKFLSKGFKLDERKKILNTTIITAYEKAAAEYQDSLGQELEFLLSLDEDEDKNKKKVIEFINAFKGEETPFERLKLVITINKKIFGGSRQTRPKVEDAFDAMEKFGVFEKTQMNKNKWRVGRLIKAALEMKYTR